MAERLLAGRNLVLRAPTGAGKTWAALAPFFFARQLGNSIADRVLYALPLRALAASLHRETRADAHAAGLEDCDIRLQTGETRDDRFFEADVVFTTIDQLLSSYLFNPVSLPARRIGNINAGALIGSLIVFDEFHLLEPGKSMDTAIEMLDRLVSSAPLAQFVVMTATLCTESIDWLARKLNADTISLPPDEVAALPSHQGKRRYYEWIDRPLTVNDVADRHHEGRTIVLANTVDRAQRLFSELTSLPCRERFGPKTEFRLLHSRFLPEDRKRAEECLAGWFGPEASQSDVVLVTTQVIEAGMDLSCDNLHTELAPMNSLVQRAGRCARRRGETGTVRVYELQTRDDGRLRLGPYSGRSVVIDATRSSLSTRLPPLNEPATFHDELGWVDIVHRDEERATLGRLDNLYNHRRKVHEAMDDLNSNAARDLVRDVSSIDVIVTETPEDIRFDRRQWPRCVSVPRTSLWSLASSIEGGGVPWVVKAAREEDVVPGGGLVVSWKRLTQGWQLATAGWMIAVHPAHASYSPSLGLQFGVAGAPMSLEPRVRAGFTRYAYEYEPYADHIRRVRDEAGKQSARNRKAADRLSKAYGFKSADFERWVDLACALHDVGKLAEGWQRPIMAWQDLKDRECRRPPRPGPLAHSDYDPATDWQRQRERQYQRPPHAAEGAWAVAGILEESADESIARALFTAITRHHGTWSSELKYFEFPPSATAELQRTTSGILEPEAIYLSDKPDETSRTKDFRDCLLHFTEPAAVPAWAAYAHFVRRLRLADQASLKGES